MTQNSARIVTLLAVGLWLAACASPSREQRYGSWSYVYTALAPDWWTGLVDLPGARAKAGTGSGATVAIVGTGILIPHEDLLTVVPGVATCGPPDSTQDKNGHGTQLSGIVAGRDPGNSTTGMAPGAALIPIKVDCGLLSADALTAGVDAAIARKPDVILIAIGGYPGGAPDVQAFMVDRVSKNPGILFVAASVWDGTYYAFPDWTKADNVLVVAAMTLDADAKDPRKVDPSKEIPYSTRTGHLWAPGRQIGTSDIEFSAVIMIGIGHSQFLMNGTSPAAAIVAGCAALVAKRTGVGGAALKTALINGGEPKPSLGAPPNGRLNCAKALP